MSRDWLTPSRTSAIALSGPIPSPALGLDPRCARDKLWSSRTIHRSGHWAAPAAQVRPTGGARAKPRLASKELLGGLLNAQRLLCRATSQNPQDCLLLKSACSRARLCSKRRRGTLPAGTSSTDWNVEVLQRPAPRFPASKQLGSLWSSWWSFCCFPPLKPRFGGAFLLAAAPPFSFAPGGTGV